MCPFISIHIVASPPSTVTWSRPFHGLRSTLQRVLGLSWTAVNQTQPTSTKLQTNAKRVREHGQTDRYQNRRRCQR